MTGTARVDLSLWIPRDANSFQQSRTKMDFIYIYIAAVKFSACDYDDTKILDRHIAFASAASKMTGEDLCRYISHKSASVFIGLLNNRPALDLSTSWTKAMEVRSCNYFSLPLY